VNGDDDDGADQRAKFQARKSRGRAVCVTGWAAVIYGMDALLGTTGVALAIGLLKMILGGWTAVDAASSDQLLSQLRALEQGRDRP
jgi:hypothetical protein